MSQIHGTDNLPYIIYLVKLTSFSDNLIAKKMGCTLVEYIPDNLELMMLPVD